MLIGFALSATIVTSMIGCGSGGNGNDYDDNSEEYVREVSSEGGIITEEVTEED
jgi:hypothetical protein